MQESRQRSTAREGLLVFLTLFGLEIAKKLQFTPAPHSVRKTAQALQEQNSMI